MIPRW